MKSRYDDTWRKLYENRSFIDTLANYDSDIPGSAAAALNPGERVRLASQLELEPGHVLDLGQTDSHRMTSHEDECLHTLIKGMGLMWIPSRARWYITSELYTAMGFPVDAEFQRITGVSCFVSRGVRDSNPRRTFASLRSALGNAMHVNAVGSVLSQPCSCVRW